ncbi:MAG: transporter substrate-binding domain-containing protein [Acidimicrobiales bacterium]
MEARWRPSWSREILKELVQRISLIRQFLLMAGVLLLLLASNVAVGAAPLRAAFDLTDANLVPTSLKDVTWEIATDASYPPDEWMSGTKMVGFDVALMGAIAKTLGVTIHENNVTFDAIIAGIKSGKYEVGNSSFLDTKALEKSVNFVDYFRGGEGVYAVAGTQATFSGLSSLCSLTVAVVDNTAEQTAANAEVAKCPPGNSLTVHAYRTQKDAKAAVLSDQAQEAFVDSQVAGYFVSLSKGQLELVGDAVDVAPYGLATAKTSTGHELAIAIQAALDTLVENGTYRAILAQWGVGRGALALGKILINAAIS